MASKPTISSTSVRFGQEFEFDLRSYELKRSGLVQRLERIPAELLRLLIQHRGELVTRDQIVGAVWGKDVFLDTDNSINAAIRKIRQVLGDDPAHPSFVQTLTGRGYRFIATVEESGATPVAQVETGSSASGDQRLGGKISHYRIIRLLGGGGMGLVYEAEDLKLGRRVALKLLPGELASDPKAFERFEQEARAASALDHPNICGIHQLGEQDGQPFIVMPLLQGETLREWIGGRTERSTPACLRQLVDLAIQIAEGLDAAHQKGIIHRDIKPANIFVTNRGQAKILDFGVAKFVQSAELGDEQTGSMNSGVVNHEANRTAASLGTPSYLSPEQIRREKLDVRTDLFSFGLVLYEMATGQRAFSGDTVTHIRNAVLQVPAAPVHQLNSGVPAQLERIIEKSLVKDRDLRWQTAREIADELRAIEVPGAPAEIERPPLTKSSNAFPVLRLHLGKIAIALGIALTIAAVLGLLHYRSVRAGRLNERDTVVLTDFSNNTGDPLFDGSLKQILKISLTQSPFLNVLPDKKIRSTLKLMTQPVNTPISPSIAREVCQRSGSKAYIAGAIASLDTDYVIGLKAENCLNHATLAQEQVTAHSKDEVISAVGDAATRLRIKLGESIASVKKFDVPLRQATTNSLEALKEYTLAGQVENEKGPQAAISHYKNAVALDPLFARAYSALAGEYFDTGESFLAATAARKAYDLRDRVTDLEKIQIEASYHSFATGDLQKAANAYQRWAEITPWYAGPLANLAFIYAQLGLNDKALSASLEAARIGDTPEDYTNVVSSYLSLGRLEEAKATFDRVESRHLNTPFNHTSIYLVAFLQHDTAAMQRELAWAKGKPEVEWWMLYLEACTRSYYGEMKKARQFYKLARTAAVAADQKETASSYRADAALHEALFGNFAIAERDIGKVLENSNGQDAEAAAALTYAFAGNRTRAQALADDLAKRYPQNTLVQSNYLPTILGQLSIHAQNPAQALELLKPVRPFELGQPAQAILLNLYPVFVRGQAYLAVREYQKAMTEFQEILEHPGMSLNEPIVVLARLGIARAYAADGQRERARSAYQDLLTLWKTADPDIPVLKQARAEYAKLESHLATAGN